MQSGLLSEVCFFCSLATKYFDLCFKFFPVAEVARLRELSPLWEMMQEGIDLKTIQWSQPH
jgi:hypothetical protein